MRKLALVLAVLGLLTLGCAQDEPAVQEPEATTATTSSPAASGELEYNEHGTETLTEQTGELEMELDDFYFEPTFIKLPGDATVTITLNNEGDAAHTFTAEDLNVDEELQPGATEEVEVTVGTETRYEFLCRFHEGQGMRGAFQPH